MKISVFGLGYVGVTNAVCFANRGHYVIGVDVNLWKVRSLNYGNATFKEKDIEVELQKSVNKQAFYATLDTKMAVSNSEVSFICVGTPLKRTGDVSLVNIVRVVKSIGVALKEKNEYHLVVIKSTIPPGTTKNVIIPLISKFSGKNCGGDFGICVNPEFIREGSMVEDFLHPGLIIIGELDKKSGDLLNEVYRDFDAKIVRSNIETAEMAKYAFNAFHALKISFANEIGNICALYGIDANVISKILCSDEKLNISPKYLEPGFAFGGSCLPKDLHTLINRARRKGYIPHLLQAIINVNEFQKEKALRIIRQILKGNLKNKKIAILGVAFKEGTDDIRESPALYEDKLCS